MKRMTAAGNKPVLKVYPGVGHFIHTDVPYEFARDTVDFLSSGRVDAMSPEVVETLIRGVPAVGGDATAAAKPTGLAK